MDQRLLLSLTLLGGVLPGVIALITLFLFWMLHAHRANMKELEFANPVVSDGPRWLLPVLLAIGAIACDLVINAGMRVWPQSATERYVHVFMLLGLLGFVEGLIRWPIVMVLIARILAYASIVWMLASPYVQSEILTNQELVAWMALAGVGGAVLAQHSDRALRHTKAWNASLVFILVLGGLMWIFNSMFFAYGSQTLIGPIAVLVNVCIVSLLFKRVRVSRGGISFIVGMLIAYMVGTGIQNEPNYIAGIALLALLPLAASIPGKGGFRSLLTRAGAVLLLLGIVGGMIQWQSTLDSSDDAGYDEYESWESSE